MGTACQDPPQARPCGLGRDIRVATETPGRGSCRVLKQDTTPQRRSTDQKFISELCCCSTAL